jgi:hypothetical protein
MKCLTFLGFTLQLALMRSSQPVRLYPILMSILLFNFKQLTQCVSEVERIETKVNNSGKRKLMKEVKKEEEIPTTITATLDSYLEN